MSLNKNSAHRYFRLKLRSERTTSSTIFNKRMFITVGYIIYLTLIFLSMTQNVAEYTIESWLQDSIEYHLTFTDDGWNEHYYVDRYNESQHGTIDVIYTYETNTLEVDCSNIKNLVIACRSMFEEKSEEVFGVSSKDNSNYYKIYFIEKNHLNVNIDTDNNITSLTFKDTPIPYEVRVNDDKWLEDTNYFFEQDYGVVLTNVPGGHSNVDVYFKSTDTKVPVAILSSDRSTVFIGETVYFSAESSYDPDLQELEYFWDFGDGNFAVVDITMSHKYDVEGVYGVILTVRDEDQLISHAYLNITVLDGTRPVIRGEIPDQAYMEDSDPWELNLTGYEPRGDYSDREFSWFATGENTSLFTLTGENSTNDIFIFTPSSNAYGNDRIRVWVADTINEISLYQDIWVNITPVNDAPYIIDAPDLVVQYDQPYMFDYTSYIKDIDTDLNNIELTTSDSQHAQVNGLEVTYLYSQDYIGKDNIFVILKITDQNSSNQYLIEITVIDGLIPKLTKELPDVDIYEGETLYHVFNLYDHFSPLEGDFSYRTINPDKVTVLIHENLSVTLKAPHDWFGSEVITIRIISRTGALVEDNFRVNVKQKNDAPIINPIPDVVVRYDQNYLFSLKPYLYDEDDPIETLSISTSDPVNIRVGATRNYILILNYPEKSIMPYTEIVTLYVTDGTVQTTDTFKIIVTSNHPPELLRNIPDFTFYEDTVLDNAFNIFDHFIDEDGGSLEFALSTTNIIAQIKEDGNVKLHATENWFGEEIIFVTARDDSAVSAFLQTEFSVFVVPVNDPPVIAVIPEVSLNTSETARLDLLPYVTDIDNEIYELKMSIINSNIGSELYGFDLILYGNESATGKLDLELNDGQDSANQIVLVSVVDKSSVTSGIEAYLWMFVMIIIIIILISSIFGYRRYYGNYKIVETFLIYENGCLIKHTAADKNGRKSDEVDLVGSMFTAVQDFIEDSFSEGNTDNKVWSLKRMEFGENNILIERGESIYLAVVFSGSSGIKLIRQVKDIVVKIESDYKDELKDWSGDLDIFSDLKVKLQ